MIVVKAIKDRYGSSSDSLLDQSKKSGQSPQNFIRRPTRGIQIKEDTFATLRLVTADDGRNISLVDAGSRREVADIDGKRATDIYSNFLLQQVQEERAEKQQILETFGEAYIFLFGQRARVITFSGILINTFDFNWESEWWHNYDNYLRGTKCVENDARVYISYDQTLVGGYILSTSSAKDTLNKNHVQFQFQLFVTYYGNFSAIGDSSAYSGSPLSGFKNDQFTAGTILRNDNEATITQAQLDQYRPKMLAQVPAGGKIPTTLFEGLELGISKVQDQWSKVDAIVNNTINKIQGFLNADIGTRIPIGFAGSLIFDPEEKITIGEIAASQSISYTDFSDNWDEFVGKSDHYGTSELRSGILTDFGDNADVLTYSQKMVNSARDVWSKNGFEIPVEELGPVSKFLVSKAVGMTAVGVTAAWQAANTALKAGSADPAVPSSDALVGGQLPHLVAPVGGF